MARAVRFTKPERELILDHCKEIASCPIGISKSVVAAAQSVIAKLEEAEHPKEKSTGLTVNQAVAAFRSVLDRRLVVPPNGAGLVYIQMQAKLKALALTYEQCVTAASQAGREWQGSIKAQSILNQAEKLLHNAESEPLPTESSTSNDFGRYESEPLLTEL